MRFAARRLGFFLLTLWVAVTLNFVLPRLMPGNPAIAMIAKFRGGVSPQALRALEIQFGVFTKQSMLSQYFGYLGNLATGKLGVSTSEFPTTVGTLISHSIWWTLGLLGLTTMLAFILGTGIGIVSAWRRGSILNRFFPPPFGITSV